MRQFICGWLQLNLHWCFIVCGFIPEFDYCSEWYVNYSRSIYIHFIFPSRIDLHSFKPSVAHIRPWARGVHHAPPPPPHIPTKLCFSEPTGDPLHSRALAHSRAPLFTQPCSHCSHSRAPGEQWARLCVFTLHGCVQAARLCRGSPVEPSECPQ